MAFCDLSHTFYKQVTNFSQHVFVILLWGVLTSPLTSLKCHYNPPTSLAPPNYHYALCSIPHYYCLQHHLNPANYHYRSSVLPHTTTNTNLLSKATPHNYKYKLPTHQITQLLLQPPSPILTTP